MFVDRVKIEVQAGKGGNGCVSFRREKYVPRGGPDGGDGGDGGSVIIQAQTDVHSLAELAHKKLWKAERGHHGEGSNRHGKSGRDVIIRVPLGTVVFDAPGGFILKDLTADGQSMIAALRGKGGKGNTHFKSSTNRAPREFTPGEDGQKRILILELKSIAEVGLVGKPNAGKSTMLSRLSHARPEIADYPFTTKHPNLGQVQIDADHSFVMADIPGLIEGAHAGVGLGHEFLRHVERAGILVHLVEPAPLDGTDPVQNYRTIRSELIQYDPSLGRRREIVAITKAELPGADEVQRQLQQELDHPVLLVSAVTGQGLNVLVRAIADVLEAERAAAAVNPAAAAVESSLPEAPRSNEPQATQSEP